MGDYVKPSFDVSSVIKNRIAKQNEVVHIQGKDSKPSAVRSGLHRAVAPSSIVHPQEQPKSRSVSPVSTSRSAEGCPSPSQPTARSHYADRNQWPTTHP